MATHEIDDNALRAFAVPGWEEKASQFADLVTQLAKSSNSSLVPELEKQIQHLQREESAWLIGFYALTHDDPHVRFYGALTLTVKINTQWDSLERVERGPAIILNALSFRYLQLTNVNDHALVLRKLASSLSAYCLQPSAEWCFPVRDLLARFAESCGNQDIGEGTAAERWPRIRTLTPAALRSLLVFCSTWIEEVVKFDFKTLAGSKVYDRAARNAEDVWFLVRCLMESVQKRSGISPGSFHANDVLGHVSEEDVVVLARETISTALSWTKAGDLLTNVEAADLKDLLQDTVSSITACFFVAPLADAVMEFLSYIVETVISFQRFIPKESLPALVESDQVRQWLETLTEDGEASEGVRVATFLDALVDMEDFSSPEWAEEGSLNYLLPIFHALLQVPGVPGVENAVASICLDIWTRLADGFSDWVGSSDADDWVKSELQKVVVEAFPKTTLPKEELDPPGIWDQDERTKFNSFHQDYVDFLMACHTSIPGFVIGFLHQKVVESLRDGNWSVYESATYGIADFADTFGHDGERDEVYQNIFESQVWRSICSNQLSVPLKARQATVNLIACSAKFLQRHEEYLPTCMAFLFSRLGDESQAYLASEAINTLCYARRASLIPALPEFFSALTALNNMKLEEQRRIFASVAAVIQALPSEEAKVEPLKELLKCLFRQGARIPQTGDQQDEDTKSAAAAFLYSLASIGKGLRAPEETAIAIDEEPTPQSNFWVSGSGSEVQNMILQALFEVFHNFRSYEVTCAACEVFKAGYTEKDPFPFRFAPSISAQFLVPLIQKDGANVGDVLSTITSFFASHAWSAKSIQNEFQQVVLTICQNQRQLIDSYSAGQAWEEQAFTSGSLDLLESVLLRYCPQLLEIQGVLPQIFEFALLCLRNPDILPRRSATKFWTTAFDLSGYNSRLCPDVSPKWDQALAPIMPHFAALILQLAAGECARSEIEAISQPLRRFVEKQGNQAKNLFKSLIEDRRVMPASSMSNLDSAARQAFVQKVLMLRGAKKTDAVVREFWIACRGSNFAYTS